MPSTSAMLIIMMTIKNRPILISPLRQESPTRMNLRTSFVAPPEKAESPAWGKRGFLKEARNRAGATCFQTLSAEVEKRFKTTAPPERSMFARRRCRRTG